MIGKKILGFELFHPSNQSGIEIPRGVTVANSTLLSLALGVFLNHRFQLRIHIVIMCIFIIIFAGLLVVFDQNKNNLLCYLVIVGAIIGGLFIGRLFHVNYVNRLEQVYQWCLTYDGDKSNYNKQNGLAVMAGILLLSSSITYIMHRYKKVKNFVAILLVSLLIYASVHAIFIPKLTVGVIIFYSLTILVEFCGIIFRKISNIVDNSVATIYLAPVCGLIAFLAISLPSKSEPIEWKGVKNVLTKVQEQSSIWKIEIKNLFDKTGTEFSVSFAGYSDEEEDDLGGEVSGSETTSLLISTTNKSTAKGYLIGSISDQYTGRRWERSELANDYNMKDYNLDFYELLNAIIDQENTGMDVSNLVKKRNFGIEYYDIKTRSLFYPLKTYRINYVTLNDIQETGQGAFLYKKAKSVGTKYEVEYYELNLNSEQMQSILRDGSDISYNTSRKRLLEGAYEIFRRDITDLDLEVLKKDLLERENRIRIYYTSLPETLPDRVKDLAYELTMDYDNDYDKLKAIEIYLNTLSYTTKVGKTPKGEDFVDYFLFEQQKGYCTYFASAMGVLARCVGIPTRYVEGFVVDYKQKDSNNTYKVISGNAHSWIDAYIDGIGWIPFEPTPAFHSGRYTAWKESASNTGYQSSGIPAENNLGSSPNYEDMMNAVNQDSFIVTSKRAANQYIFPVVGIILCTVLLFSFVFLLYYRILEIKYAKRFKNSSNNIKLSFLFTEILRYVNKDGYLLLSEETLLTYAKKIGNKINFNNTRLIDVTTIFMRVRYGEKQIKEEELQLVIQFNRDLECHLKEKLGKRKMFFERFAFLHFHQ